MHQVQTLGDKHPQKAHQGVFYLWHDVCVVNRTKNFEEERVWFHHIQKLYGVRDVKMSTISKENGSEGFEGKPDQNALSSNDALRFEAS